MKKTILITSLFLYLSILIFAQNKASDITGIWYMNKSKDGTITVAEVYEENDKYYAYGFDYKVKGGNNKIYDINNPEPSKRNATLKGLIVIYKLSFNGNEWENGYIYNPENGKTYNLNAKLKNKNTLVLRASVDKTGIFGDTMKWTMVEANNNYKTLNKTELRLP